MAKQTINVGTSPNDRSGDPLRVAFTKANDNFTELYNNVSTLSSGIVTDVSELTDTQGLFFTGNYSDLSNTPFIPSDLGDLTDTSNSLTVKNHIELTGTRAGNGTVITFTKPPNTDANTYFDLINDRITFTRDAEEIGGIGGGIYNSAAEDNWDPTVSPLLTFWNWDGWDDLTDVQTRYYEPLRQVLKHRIGQNIVGAELVMKDPIGNEYYKIKFTQWAQGAAHDGSFAYTREKIDVTNSVGLTFSDNSLLLKAPDTRVSFPQSYIGDYGDYIITDNDVGRQLYAYGNTMDLPSSAAYDFKIGDTIQIVSGHQPTAIRPLVNQNIELPDAVLYAQGSNTAVSSFTIPVRSMAFLTKIDDNSWQLSVGNTSNLSANTGDITFDGIKIQGAGTASGDGNGYSTIELVPDTDLYTNDQYLIVDPTQPSHIHIRAGGAQDASVAELFLGGEKNHVRVIDGTGVRLYNEERNDTFSYFQDSTDFNTATWYGTPGNYFIEFTQVTAGMGDLAFTFGNDNENRVTVYYGAGQSSVLTYGSSSSNLGGGVYRFAVVEAPPVSPTSLTAMEFQIWSTNNNRIELQNNDLTISVADDIRITGNDIFSLRNRSTTEGIEIRTDYDNADRIWVFGANGTMETPGDVVVSGDVTGTIGASTLILRAQPTSNTSIQLNNIVDSAINTVANLEIRTDVSNIPYIWTFSSNGSLEFPDNTMQTTAWSGGRVVDVPTTSPGAVGDKQGDLAFNGSYIYYCTQDFVESSYSSTIAATYSGAYPSIVKGSIPQPQAGWNFIHDGNTYTLAANATEGNPGVWTFELTSSISVTIGDSVTIGPASVANIWKRVAWSGDTW